MDQVVERLSLLLENNVPSQEDAILDTLEELASSSQDATPEELAAHDLDDVLVTVFERVSEESHVRVVALVLDLIPLMRDPRNIYSSIETYFVPECSFSMEVANAVHMMRRSFNFEFDNFFDNLFDCMTPGNIENDVERKLFFLLTVFEDRSTPLATVKPFIKKLCGISLQTGSRHSHKILWTVLWIMRLHPMAYAMAGRESFDQELEWCVSVTMHEFQPYLFELDILQESLDGIRSVVRMIRNEAAHVGSRPRFVSLASFAFPRLEMTSSACP